MSVNCGTMCCIILGESFGPVIKMVGEVILAKGPVPLGGIVTSSGFTVHIIQDSLKTLIQHSLVGRSTSLSNETLYMVDTEHVFELTRYAKYLDHEEKASGSVGREILEEIVRAGSLSISKLVYICGFRVKKSNPDIAESALLDQLSLFRSTIRNLVLWKHIEQILPQDEVIPESERTARKECFVFPEININNLCGKLFGKTVVQLDDLPDADIVWRINVKQFHAELRNNLIYQAIERKFSPMIDPRIFKILIDLGFEKHAWEKDGSPVSTAEIKDKIEKLDGGTVTSRYLAEHFEIVEEDPKRLVSILGTSQGGHFSFNMKTAVAELIWSTIDRVIIERHGFFALRIFRLVKDKGFIEQDKINELGMIPAKDAKHLTYKLVEEHFLCIKEVRKSYAATAIPGKVIHVFYVDIAKVVRSLREFCYKAMVNLKQREKAEKDKTKRLVLKEERISRILVNMTNKACSEDQMNEIRELITPPERGLLMKYQFQTGRLTSGAMHVDETLFIIQLFMHYHKTTPPVKGSKKTSRA